MVREIFHGKKTAVLAAVIHNLTRDRAFVKRFFAFLCDQFVGSREIGIAKNLRRLGLRDWEIGTSKKFYRDLRILVYVV